MSSKINFPLLETYILEGRLSLLYFTDMRPKSTLHIKVHGYFPDEEAT